MKMRIDESDFIDIMNKFNTGFSYEALVNLFHYLEEMDDDYELDPIALRSEFSEYEIDELIDMYSLNEEIEGLKNMDKEDVYYAVLDWLNDRTTTIEGKEYTIVIADF